MPKLATHCANPNACRILGRERTLHGNGDTLWLCDDSGGMELHTLDDADLTRAILEWAAWRREQDRRDALSRERRERIKAVTHA